MKSDVGGRLNAGAGVRGLGFAQGYARQAEKVSLPWREGLREGEASLFLPMGRKSF